MNFFLIAMQSPGPGRLLHAHFLRASPCPVPPSMREQPQFGDTQPAWDRVQQLPVVAKGQRMASSGEESGEGASPRATVVSAVALSRLRMRQSFIQRPDPRAFRSGDESREGVVHLMPSRLHRTRLALRQMGVSTDQQLLAHKELIVLQHKRRAVRCLRHDLW